MRQDEAEFRANAIAARYLRRWREEAGMSVAEAAYRLNTSVAHVESYEDGSVEIDVAELMVLARLYGADIGELLRELDDMLGTRRRGWTPPATRHRR